MKRRFLSPRSEPAAPPQRPASRYARQRARGLVWASFPQALEDEYQRSDQGRASTRVQILAELAALLLAWLLVSSPDPARMTLLGCAVAMLLGLIFMIGRQGRSDFLAFADLRELAQADSLTGVMNRRAFLEHLERVWRQAERAATPIGLVLVDLDHFKQVNDRLGHLVGDRALERAAGVLLSYAGRPFDAVGRYGGDEFIVAWYDPDRAAFESLVQLLPAKLWAGLAAVHEEARDLTVSGGAVYVTPSREHTIEQAIHCADLALYEVKRTSRGTIALATVPEIQKSQATGTDS